MKNLPDKIVERLSQYRRSLNNQLAKGKSHIFSHEIANLLHITPVQVRRDIMLIGYSGTLRKGYNIQELVSLIGLILDTDTGEKIAVVGMGNLGKAFIHYMYEKRTKLNIIAAFDVNPEKVDKEYANVKCYHLDKLDEIVKAEGISIGIITTPPEYAKESAERLRDAGVVGILNYTPKPLLDEEGIYLEEYDMITSLEKVAYFVKHRD